MAVATSAFGAATLSADTVESTVSGGILAATTYGAIFEGITLDGANQISEGTSSPAWSFEDARGTGAPWSITAVATAWTSDAGTVDDDDRTIAVDALSITVGTITAGAGADSVSPNLTGETALVMSVSAQTLIASAGTNKGTYAATPTYTLTVPANAYRSNYTTDVGEEEDLNPYTATITYTIL